MRHKADYQEEIERLRSATGCDLIAMAIVESAENQYVLKWKYASGHLNNRLKRIVLKSGRGIAGLVFKTGKPLYIPKVSEFIGKDNLFNYPILTSENLKSIGAVPLWHGGRVAGVLIAGFRTENLMTEELMQIMLTTVGKGIGNLDGKELMAN